MMLEEMLSLFIQRALLEPQLPIISCRPEHEKSENQVYPKMSVEELGSRGN